MTVLNTRLKESDREATIKSLVGTLNNVVRFYEQPIRDKTMWANLWNSKFPPELFEAMKVCSTFGYAPSTYEATSIRVVVQQEDKHYSSQIMLNWLPGELPDRKPIRMTTQLRKMSRNVFEVRQKLSNGGSSIVSGILLTSQDYNDYLGGNTEHFLEWITTTSKLRLELTEAKTTIEDLVTMAKTAGQIKRMVPDLLQYLPAELRHAYQNQVRASSLPFEWAPYPRDRVERMITAIGKGHLLAGMAKKSQSGWEVGGLDNVPWGAEVTLVGEKSNFEVVQDEDD